ncbi:MAG: SDR family oxidoreductase [Nitrospinae bacterium]|nr:SDR family oxidoreductase [Nitrospinota bacterium]
MHERSSIKDHVAIVTGATDGIGLATAIRFADEGAKVAIMGRDPERGSAALAQVSLHGDAIFVQGDAAQKEDIDLLFARALGTWSRLDILVNCAGGFVEVSDIEGLDEAEWEKIVKWNLTSCYLATRAATAPMKERGYGRIVNISSISARDGLANVSLVYSAAKSAMQGFTRRLAVELAPHGITVNAVAPGVTLTKRFRLVHGERVPQIVANLPVGFGGEPEDIADAIWYFSTPGSGYVTGATIDVNGGQYVN